MHKSVLFLSFSLWVSSCIGSPTNRDIHEAIIPDLSTYSESSTSLHHLETRDVQATQNAWDNCLSRKGLQVLCCDYSRSVNGAIRDPDGKFSKDCIPATKYQDCAQTDGDGYRVKYDHGPYCCGTVKKGRLSCTEINLRDRNGD